MNITNRKMLFKNNGLTFSGLLFLGILFSYFQIAVATPILPALNSSHSGQQINGKFIWFELATVNPQQHTAFYGKVFGWQFKTLSNSAARYTLISNNGRNIGGMFTIKNKEQAKRGGVWIGLMSINDPDKAALSVKSAGGKVHTPPTTITNRGTFAFFIDPQGAIFGVLKSSSGDPVDKDIKTGEFLWVDLFTKDLAKAGEFYRQLAGYDVTKSEATTTKIRLILNAQNKPRAGIVPLPKNANRAGWLPYIKVDNIQSTLSKVEAAGGYVMVPPDKTLLDGNLAIFTDPLGGIMGIVKQASSSNANK